MARTIGKLSALGVSRLKEKGLYADGGGLYLRVKESGGKFWIYRFMLQGKAREMGLGALHALTLADARIKAADCRKLLSEGKDPIDFRDDAKTQRRLAAAKTKTFKECAEAYVAAHEVGWRNAKHAQQWKNTLATYVYPIMGNVPVQDVDLNLVAKVLQQKNKAFRKGENLWAARPETAGRLRGRIEVILDWAATLEYRKGENPARWRGRLENLLPKRSKVQRVKHHPALPYDQIGDFMAALKAQEGTAALALYFTILTACRTSEAVKASWGEIDFEKMVWTIPENRIKAGREHRVPLSKAAMDILKAIKKEQDAVQKSQKGASCKWVFTATRRAAPLSDMALLALLRRMNGIEEKPRWIDPHQNKPITTHGFRSTLRDWAAEQTNFPREVAEAALAHAVGDKVEAAYRRSDLFDKRRQMMDAWARYCAMPSVKERANNVTSFQKR